jgi:hypothetical protein
VNAIRRSLPRTPLPHTVALLAVLALGGCGGGSGATAGVIVDVQERDFHISAPQHVHAGVVTLRVHNTGPDRHELIVARDDRALPMRSDGLTVDEEAVQHDEPGALEPAQAGALRDLHVDLHPGRYVLFCNMAGHYLGGMHASLVASQ